MYTWMQHFVRGTMLSALLVGWAGAEEYPTPQEQGSCCPPSTEFGWGTTDAPRLPNQAELMEKHGLSPGLQITAENADLIKDLVPEPVYQRTKNGDYVFTIGQFDPPDLLNRIWDPTFYESTKNNIGKYGMDDIYGIVDASGKRPFPMPLGYPYPELDFTEDNNKIAAKIIWNAQASANSTCNEVDDPGAKLFTGPRGGGYERLLDLHVIRQLIEFRRAPIQIKRPVIFQEIFYFLAPSDVFGTAQLSWRWADPTKNDSVWIYSPAVRRMRRLTAANRSEGILGTEFALDDAEPIYAGKVEMMDWKFLGVKASLLPVSRKIGQAPDDYVARITNQGIPSTHYTYKKVPGSYMPPYQDLYFGYQDESNDYAAWWTVNMLWVPVPMYVIEATPKDPYYNYGKQIYEFEPHLFIPGWKQAYNRAGEYWRTILLWIEYTRFLREGKLNVCSDARAAIAVDDKVNRGTVIMADGGLAAGKGQHLDTHYVPVGLVPATQFDLARFLELGK